VPFDEGSFHVAFLILADQGHTFEGRLQRRDGFAAHARREKILLSDQADLGRPVPPRKNIPVPF
jgi:hypothetical protein